VKGLRAGLGGRKEKGGRGGLSWREEAREEGMRWFLGA